MKMINKINKIIAVITVILLTVSCEKDNDPIVKKLPTIAEVINSDLANYSVLKKGLETSLLFVTFTNNGSYTLFTPNNAAFAAYTSTNFPAGITEAILTSTTTPLTVNQSNELKRVLMYHVISVATNAKDIPASDYLKTFSPFGTSTSISLSAFFNKTAGVVINGGVANGGAVVTAADIEATNGVVHKIDAVLKLPTLVNQVIANPALSTLLTTVTAPAQAAVLAQLVTPAFNKQLFAPDDKAFTDASAYLTGKSTADVSKILRYHIATAGSFTRTENIGTSVGNINNGAASNTTFLPINATTDATVTTRANVGTTAAFQTFRIERNSVKIFEIPAVTTLAASKMKTVNIHTSNGIIHIVDRVLQPTLP